MIVWVTGKKTIRKRAGEYLISDEGTFRTSDGRWPAVVSGHDVHKTFESARAYLTRQLLEDLEEAKRLEALALKRLMAAALLEKKDCK